MQSFIYLETIDSGGSQESTIKQKLLSQTAKENMVIESESSSMPESNTLENTDTSIEETSFDSTSTVKESSSILESASAGENETVSNTNHNSENTDTEVADIKVTETEVAKTEVVETEIAETEITETEVVETEVTETEIVESPSTNGSDTVETESDPSNTEMVVPVSVISAAVTAVSNQNCSVCTENFADCTATIIIDLIETPINENVVWFCSLIDSMPTAEQLYAEAPNSRDELYNTWLSETKEILLQIGELQEQYHLFSEEDKAYIGADRKSKLDALGEMAGKLLEGDVVYAVDINFSDDKGLFYEVLKDNNSQVQIVSYGNYISALENSLEIPSQVADENNNYYTVVSIGERAFSGCSNLTNVFIPDSIKNINAKAFLNCTNLETVTVSENITINDQAFSGCSKLSTLKIKMNNNGQISPIPVYDIDVFNGCALNRNIVFKQQTAQN